MGKIRISLESVYRFFISAVFFAGAIKNIVCWNEAENSLLNALSEWQSHFVNFQEVQIFFSYMMSWSWLLLSIGVALSFLGALSLLIAYRERLGLVFLSIFLITASMLFHPFWWVDGASKELHTVMFLKNLSILGCLLRFLSIPKPVAVYEDSMEEVQDYPPLGY